MLQTGSCAELVSAHNFEEIKKKRLCKMLDSNREAMS